MIDDRENIKTISITVSCIRRQVITKHYTHYLKLIFTYIHWPLVYDFNQKPKVRLEDVCIPKYFMHRVLRFQICQGRCAKTLTS